MKRNNGTASTALIIDGSNYAYRGLYAIRDLTNSEGIPTNAVRGFFQILSTDLKILRPTYVAVAFDRTRSARRLSLYPEYKGNRIKEENDPMPHQLRIIRQLLRARGVPTIGIVGEEADDIIATIAERFAEQRIRSLISSSDKDFAQLVSEYTSIVEARTRKVIDRSGVFRKWGVKPQQIVDYLSLLGDGVDNIPGVPKVGPKTAAQLLREYGSIKEIIRNTKKLTKVVGANIAHAHKSGTLGLAQQLIILNRNVNVNFTLDRFKRENFQPDFSTISKICKSYELRETEKLIWGM